MSRVEWNANKSEYVVHLAEDLVTVKVDDDYMLLKKVMKKGNREFDMSQLVDRFSSEAAPSDVFEVKRMLDHKEVRTDEGGKDTEYLVQ